MCFNGITEIERLITLGCFYVGKKELRKCSSAGSRLGMRVSLELMRKLVMKCTYIINCHRIILFDHKCAIVHLCMHWISNNSVITGQPIVKKAHVHHTDYRVINIKL